MQTISINLYTFDELSDKAKQKVLSDLSDINVDYEWYNNELDNQEDELIAIGYKDLDIQFSGFCSQGDGASFTGSVDLHKLNKHLKLDLPGSLLDLFDEGELQISIVRDTHQYYHERTVSVEISGNLPAQYDNTLADLQEKITAHVRECSIDIYNNLEKQYENLTSEEAIIETINANEYTFEADGKMRNE